MKKINLLVATIVLASFGAAHAQINTLATFDGSPSGHATTDGGNPSAGLTLSADGSTFYGTTVSSGTGAGTVFSVPVTGGTPTTLASFNGTSGPALSSLLLSGDTLYGTTNGLPINPNAGQYGPGIVFSVPVLGGTPTTLASIAGGNSYDPNSGLTLIGSTLYGESFNGGAQNEGSVYSLPKTGGTPTTVTSFYATNGENPEGGLIANGNTLYGTVVQGGLFSGTVFSVPATGGNGTHATLASFPVTNLQSYPPTVNDGSPMSGVILVGNTLYGTASGAGVGSTNDGTIFSVPAAGGNLTPTVLATFTGSNGSTPTSSLTLSGSTLYGTTEYGGTNNDGTIFSFDLNSDTLTVLSSFNGTNGANPMGNLTLIGNTLYGTTEKGGADNDGTVFSLQLQATPEPSTWVLMSCGLLLLLAYWRRRSYRLQN